MTTYVPNALQATEPIESRTVESAALEFRTLKNSVNDRIDEVAADLVIETSERILNDDLIVGMVSPYITQIANLGFAGNMDLGLINDSIITAAFDLGTLTGA